MTILNRLLSYFRPYRGRAAAALLAMALVALSTGALVFFFRSLFDDVLAPVGGNVSQTEVLSKLGGGRVKQGVFQNRTQARAW